MDQGLNQKDHRSVQEDEGHEGWERKDPGASLFLPQ